MLDRSDDVVVPGATAQVALDAVADLVLTRVVVVLEERNGAHDHARSAEAALESVTLPESDLYGVEFVPIRYTFDRPNRSAIRLDGKHGARLDCATIDNDGACSAVSGVAPDVGAGEAQILAEVVHEQRPGFDIAAVICSVY